MVVSLKNVSMVSSKLLVTAKSVAADPSAPNARNQLAAAARWEHWLTNQTLEVICFFYYVCFHSRSSTSFKILFLLLVTTLLFIQQVYNCITHMPIILIPVHIFSYTWKPWQTCCCSSFSSFSASCGTLTPTHYMICYHNIHTSLHTIFCH